MELKIIVPNMGESIVEATVGRWLKKVGDRVTVGEPLLELETNKANLEVAAEQTGTLVSIERREGQDVRVGETLGTISPEAAAAISSAPGEIVHEPAGNAVLGATTAVSPGNGTTPEGKITPVAERMAKTYHIDPSQITGSGVQGRVLKQDVERYLAEGEQAASAPLGSPERPGASLREAPRERAVQIQRGSTAISSLAEGSTFQASLDSREERVRLSRRRRTIAEKLVQTQHTAAMLTTFNDVDMSAVMEIRQARKVLLMEKHGIGLGIVSFFVKAVILGLKDFPRLNSEIQGNEMVIKHYFDIGIAIGDEEGLVVPILRDADRMSLVEIEKSIQSFILQLKNHALPLEAIMGGTFTITNGGVFGSLLSTPILNGPEVGILGLHRIEERPVAVNGQVVVRPMMYLALSYDHRLVDGREAVQFLARIKEAIQDPEILLIGS